MNAGLAVYGRYAYVGSRTDSSSGHPHPGVLVVDVGDPAAPRVVGEIGPPTEGNEGESSRELRVWPEQRLLMVMNLGCSATLHRCASPTEERVPATVRFYDLTGSRAAAPALLYTYRPPARVHEMFLWIDPARPGRALLYLSTNLEGAGAPSLIVLDISRAREGRFPPEVIWRGNDAFPDPGAVHLHSLGVTGDGTRAYLGYLGAGLLALDTSQLAADAPAPSVRLVTPVEARAMWPGPGPHSAVPIPGRSFVLATDEVFEPCPWAWVHLIDVSDERKPVVASEFRIAENDPGRCPSPAGTGFTFTPHNPTVLRDIAFVSWDSGGLRGISLSDPQRPAAAGEFLPEPVKLVATEDPVLTAGGNHVAAWSYPIVSGGLIYFVDVRNGLYILRYHGPAEDAVASTAFAEGNSNLR